MLEERTANKVFNNISEGKRSVGKPRNRWLYDVENDLKKMGVGGWRKGARNSDAWKLALQGATVLHITYIQWGRKQSVRLHHPASVQSIRVDFFSACAEAGS